MPKAWCKGPQRGIVAVLACDRNFIRADLLPRVCDQFPSDRPGADKMRFPSAVVVMFVLSGCATEETMPVSRAGSVEPDQAVRVFEDVCLKTAPSFSGAVQAARKAGVTNFTDGFMTIGTTRDRRMSVQIKENSECAVTTPPQKSRFLTTQFVRTINRYAELRRLPSSARIKDVPFIFQHDRTGGEAFVMLKDDD